MDIEFSCVRFPIFLVCAFFYEVIVFFFFSRCRSLLFCGGCEAYLPLAFFRWRAFDKMV